MNISDRAAGVPLRPMKADKLTDSLAKPQVHLQQEHQEKIVTAARAAAPAKHIGKPPPRWHMLAEGSLRIVAMSAIAAVILIFAFVAKGSAAAALQQ